MAKKERATLIATADADAASALAEQLRALGYQATLVSTAGEALRAMGDELLARRFFEESTRATGKAQMKLGASAVAELSAFRWPGNVRQLRNMVERLVAMAPNPAVEAEDVRRELSENAGFAPLATQLTIQNSATGKLTFSAATPLDEQLMAVERRALERALQRAGGSKVKASKLLGIGRTTLYIKLAQHGLE